MPRDFKKLNAELGMEFDRYIIEHPTWALKHIPQGAQVALQIEGNAAFILGAVGLPNRREIQTNR